MDEHHLPLVRPAVAGDSLLYLHGGVLEDGHPQLLRRQQNHPPAVGHGDAGGDILGKKQLLHRHLVGVEGVDELLHVVGNLEETAGEGDTWRGGNHAVAQEGILLPLRPNDPEADGGHPGVDAQNNHILPPDHNTTG